MGGVRVAGDVPDELVEPVGDGLVADEDAELLAVGVDHHRPAGLLVDDRGPGVERGAERLGVDVEVQAVLDGLGLGHRVDPDPDLVADRAGSASPSS